MNACRVAAGAVVLLLLPAVAAAYCRTTTVAPAPGFVPVGDTCWTQGDPLFWKDRCIAVGVAASGSKTISYASVASLATQAFQTWMGATCSTGAPSLTIREGNPIPISCSKVEYVKGANDNVNVILFHDDVWPYADQKNTLALTTLTFNADTGQILDADMEINSAANTITTATPVPAGSYDLLSILTHEGGHFLGLAHSGHPEAALFSTYKAQSISMRTLAPDDVTGICAAYPPSGLRPTAKGDVAADACGAVPRGALQGACPSVSAGCCAVAAGTPANGTPAVALSAFAALVLAVRRRRPTVRRARPGAIPSLGACSGLEKTREPRDTR